ncbi:DnaJ domain-containing protein [Legionella shakespearei]|nr:DnaJ domain-containing protein [Legionella shakespearei]
MLDNGEVSMAGNYYRASKKSYYDILEVAHSASTDEINKSYRKLSIRYHPDRNKDQNASEIFSHLSEAKRILTDREKRTSYDRLLNELNSTPSSQIGVSAATDFSFSDFLKNFMAREKTTEENTMKEYVEAILKGKEPRINSLNFLLKASKYDQIALQILTKHSKIDKAQFKLSQYLATKAIMNDESAPQLLAILRDLLSEAKVANRFDQSTQLKEILEQLALTINNHSKIQKEKDMASIILCSIYLEKSKYKDARILYKLLMQRAGQPDFAFAEQFGKLTSQFTASINYAICQAAAKNDLESINELFEFKNDELNMVLLEDIIQENLAAFEMIYNQCSPSAVASTQYYLSGWGIAHYAVYNNRVRILEFLNTHQPELLTVKTNSSQAYTPLLLGLNTYPKISDWLPSWLPGGRNHPRESIKYLITQKLGLSIADPAGNFPIHIAAQNLEKEWIDLLVKHGADVTQKNSKNETALQMYDYANSASMLGSLFSFFGSGGTAQEPDSTRIQLGFS